MDVPVEVSSGWTDLVTSVLFWLVVAALLDYDPYLFKIRRGYEIGTLVI